MKSNFLYCWIFVAVTVYIKKMPFVSVSYPMASEYWQLTRNIFTAMIYKFPCASQIVSGPSHLDDLRYNQKAPSTFVFWKEVFGFTTPFIFKWNCHCIRIGLDLACNQNASSMFDFWKEVFGFITAFIFKWNCHNFRIRYI